MSFFSSFDDPTHSIELEHVNGREDLVTDRRYGELRLYYSEGIPGVVWFDQRHSREYEVLGYNWDGPRFQDVLVQDQVSNTQTRGKRKGRLAGAIIGTILMPGVGTVIGAAVGTGRKEVSDTRGNVRSHIETQEIPVMAEMRLRDVYTDESIYITFPCTASIDARIRNNITLNLDDSEPLYIGSTSAKELPYSSEVIDMPVVERETVNVKPVQEERQKEDLIARIRELKQLLDEGAISEDEYDMLKKKLLQ